VRSVLMPNVGNQRRAAAMLIGGTRLPARPLWIEGLGVMREGSTAFEILEHLLLPINKHSKVSTSLVRN